VRAVPGEAARQIVLAPFGQLGAKAVGVGRYYLFPLAAAGRPGVERALSIMKEELERDMKLMGCRTTSELSRANVRFR
jgi:L-lactate dehydrogenase (cytochrome)